MATTGYWPVKSRLKEVIDYAENPDKTIDKRYVDSELYAALQYMTNTSSPPKNCCLGRFVKRRILQSLPQRL